MIKEDERSEMLDKEKREPCWCVATDIVTGWDLLEKQNKKNSIISPKKLNKYLKGYLYINSHKALQLSSHRQELETRGEWIGQAFSFCLACSQLHFDHSHNMVR